MRARASGEVGLGIVRSMELPALLRAAPFLAALVAGCDVPPEYLDESSSGQSPATAAPAEDGLADAYATFLAGFTSVDFDARFHMGFTFHPGLSTERVAGADGLLARGNAMLDMNSGKVTAILSNVPDDRAFDLWFVKNVAGGTVAPEATDHMFKVGSFPAGGSTRALSVSIGTAVHFDLDLIVVTRAGKKPNESCLLVGDRTLFEKRLFRFRLNKGLDPVTGALATDVETTDPLVARGAHLFFNETFGGNGRTCGTCHPAENNFTIDPKFIATLPPSDPLFVAETNPALAQLEDAQRLRAQGLILVNGEGFEDPTRDFVLRGVPHTLALGLTNGITNAFGGPPDHRLGWAGDGGPGRSTLHDFTFGAIIQHFPKTLARRPGIDFRIPTEEELDALEAFQLFTGRQKVSDFQNFTVIPTDPRAASGSNLFFSTGCTFLCHTDLSGFVDGNNNFDTGVADLTADLPADDGFSGFGFGNRTFNVPPLMEAADTPPLFHNNAAATIEDAVAFYFTPTFESSPSGGGFFISQQLTADQQSDVADFLRVVNAFGNLAQVRRRVQYIQNVRSPGNGELLTIAIADTRDARVVLSDKSLNRPIQEQIRNVQSLLEAARTTSDNNRPRIMARALSLIDSASAGLFTTPPQ